MKVGSFSGTVVVCETRFKVKKPITAFLTHFDANWILTLSIDAADGMPFKAGVEKSFAIHSPVQLLFDPDDECVGKHYAFEVDLDDATSRPSWITLRRKVTG